MQNPTQSSPTTSSVNNSLSFSASPRGNCLAIDTITACVSDRAPSLRMVNAAATEIYKRWLPHVGEVDALREAEAFASRFHFLIDGPLAPLTEPELDAVLDSVADALAQP